MKKRMKKLVSMLLSFAMLAGLLTVGASALMRTESLTMREGDTRTLWATDAEKSLGWISTNPAVVEVLSQDGSSCEVRAKAGGSATVYCRYYKTDYSRKPNLMAQHGIDYNITVTARPKITVEFDAMGGRMAGSSSKEVSYGEVYGTLPSAERSGMTFLGWYTQQQGGNRITAASKVNSTKTHTLYAHWQLIPTTPVAPEKPSAPEKPVTSEASSVSEDSVTSTVPTEDIPAPSSGGGNASNVSFDKRQVIIFSAEGGISESYTAVTEQSGTLSSLPDAVRLGHTFLGWYTAANGGKKVTTSTVFKETTTLYAHWSECKATTPARVRPSNFQQITLDTMGGWTLYERWYTNRYGSLNYLPKPIRNNDTFLGWFTAPYGGEEVTVSTVFHENATIYAHWN